MWSLWRFNQIERLSILWARLVNSQSLHICYINKFQSPLGWMVQNMLNCSTFTIKGFTHPWAHLEWKTRCSVTAVVDSIWFLFNMKLCLWVCERIVASMMIAYWLPKHVIFNKDCLFWPWWSALLPTRSREVETTVVSHWSSQSHLTRL